MFFNASEVNIELMQVLKQGSKWRSLGHLGEGVHILGEAFATVAVLAVGTGNVGMGVIDITRKKHSGMHFAPVGSHLLAVFTAGVEVGDLVGAKHVVHILGELGLERGHHCELLADENLGEQILLTGEGHRLLLEILYMGALGKELGHVAHLVASLARKAVAGAGKNSSTDKDRYVRKLFDQFRHQSQILRAVIFCWHMNLKKCNIHIAQVIIITLRRITDEKLALRVVVFQPIFEGSAYEAASDNSNVNHCLVSIYYCSTSFNYSILREACGNPAPYGWGFRM